MKNPYLTPADFWKTRDFGAKISAVFEFIGVHWRILTKCLVYFVLPFALLMGIGLGSFNNALYNRIGTAGRPGGPVTIAQPVGSPFNYLSLVGLVVAGLAAMLALVLLAGVVYGYLRARLDLPADEPVTPRLVWAQIRARLGQALLLVLLAGLAYAAVVGLFIGGITYSVGSANTYGAGAMWVGLLFLLLPLLFGVLAYLGVKLSLTFPVLWLEDASAFTAIGRSFQLTGGAWWATFGLLFVVQLIQSFVAVLFAIPQYAVLLGKMLRVPYLDSDLLGIVAYVIYAGGFLFTSVLPLLALAFQYFNLLEQREGRGLRLLVGELGQPQAVPAAHSSHYRPDEEGEY